MARRKSSRGRNKIQPAVMTLTFELSPSSFQNTVTDWIDLSQCTSIVNRRFMRQGLNWAVGGIKVLSAADFQGSMIVQKLPNTWTMSNSWEKSFRAWSRMNQEALLENETLRPKFLDFKIYADAQHHSAGYASNLLPVNYATGITGINTAVPGEWESSKVVIPSQTANTTESFELIAVGANAPGPGASGLNALSLIEGYAASRALPDIEDPNTPLDASDPAENWIKSIFSDGTEQDTVVIDDMTTENNLAPYPFEGAPGIIDTMYPNGANQLSGLQIHDLEFITGTTIGGTTRFKGGNFPCGLIGISNFQTSEGGPYPTIIQIDLIPGDHRGYLCEPMTEM